MQQILWAEIAIKSAIGIVLLLVPLMALKLVGIQKPETGFWPRLTGCLLLAIAASVWTGLEYPNAHGSIGPAALATINLTSGAFLLSTLVMGAAAPTRRGKIIVAAGVMAVISLGFLEIAHA